jgi:hypothetical protein
MRNAQCEMQNNYMIRTHNRNGTAFLHGIASGFGLPRAVTSRLRRRYDRRYRERVRFPRIAFLFDTALLIVLVALLSLVISFVAHPPVPPTVALTFAAPPELTAAAAQPMSVTLRPTDDEEHAGVRLTWHLPHGWEILASDPPMQSDGTVFFGTIPAGQERTSHVIVRLYDSVGRRASVGFTVHDVKDGKSRQYSGVGERAIASSALTAEVPAPFIVDAAAADGAVIPVQVKNASDRPVPYVELRAAETSPVQFPRAALGDLEAGESRYAYVSLGSKAAGQRHEIEWTLHAASREISRGSWRADSAAWSGGLAVSSPLAASPDEETPVRFSGGEGRSVILVLPFLEPAVNEIALPRDTQEVSIPPASDPGVKNGRWFVAPVMLTEDDGRLLGPAAFGVIRDELPFTAEARYRTEAGDQLGTGPHPPRANEETRYWIFWMVGPVQGKLTDVRVQTAAGEGVRFTGAFAAPNGGVAAISDKSARWTLREIGSEAGLTEAMFGFEISLVPDLSVVGRSVRLIGPSSILAVDAATGITLSQEEMALFSENIQDADHSLFQTVNP